LTSSVSSFDEAVGAFVSLI